jgi:hypothetical protein
MREATGDVQAGFGGPPGAVVVTALPVGVGFDRCDLGALGADLVGRRARTHRQQQTRADPVRMADDPFQRPGSPHRTADHSGNLGDTQRRQCGDVGFDLISHRYQRKP